ncbi:SpoIID/LytB domain-containing protein [Synechocystis sp. PCC 7339]|uniref:SpoIID/LytB domain-containing protein n=2 Tax=unclassified Synechocystis TaxID=2640012 RepID=UPI001CBB461B|nr:SpoIID/LytB domain-containing protein [Synechocystis sp. PCC 7339]
MKNFSGGMKKLTSFPFPSFKPLKSSERSSRPAIASRWRVSRKWALMLIPLASIGSIPLLLAWSGYGEDANAIANGKTNNGTEVMADMAGEELIKTLPPLSQIPAPPQDSASGLKSPRPITAANLGKGSPGTTTEATDNAPSATVQSSNGNNSSVQNSAPSAPSPSARPAPVPTTPQTAAAPPNLATPVDYTPPPLEIRVGIQRDVPSVAIAVSSQGYLQNRQGQGLMSLSPGQSLNVTAQGNSLLINGRSVSGVVWFTADANGYLAVGDRWYRGRVLLVPRGDKVLAVNYVNLEHYLTSVVGSEMHSTAPTEALKAQAIAARSYALVHMVRPASQWFDLGDTQRWQVYKGIGSEQGPSHNAVTATLGQVLSHNGGVVESLYASTDEIVARVHKGKGMSQYGAYDLARQGYNYQQILNRYYPGVEVARVVLKN